MPTNPSETAMQLTLKLMDKLNYTYHIKSAGKEVGDLYNDIYETIKSGKTSSSDE